MLSTDSRQKLEYQLRGFRLPGPGFPANNDGLILSCPSHIRVGVVGHGEDVWRQFPDLLPDPTVFYTNCPLSPLVHSNLISCVNGDVHVRIDRYQNRPGIRLNFDNIPLEERIAHVDQFLSVADGYISQNGTLMVVSQLAHVLHPLDRRRVHEADPSVGRKPLFL